MSSRHSLFSSPLKAKRENATFVRDEIGMAVVEFALIFPVLLLLLLALVEVSNLVTANRRLQVVANAMAQMITQSSTGVVNYVDIQFAVNSTMVLFPLVLSDSAQKGISWGNDISVTISSIVFSLQNSQCTSNCIYNANVAWSGGGQRRPCNFNLTASNDTAAPSLTTLPTDVYGPGSLVVADIVYNYTPSIWPNVLPTIRLSKSVYLQPRYIPPTSYIHYAVISGDNGIASSCPGY